MHNCSLRFWYGMDNSSPSDSSSPLCDMPAAQSSCPISLNSSPSLELVGADQHEGKLATDVLLLLETWITLKADFPDLLLLPKDIALK